MRKQKQGRKFHRESGQRKAMLKITLANFLFRGKIKTTTAKAKELKSLVEKSITKAKKGDIASRRNLLKILPEKTVKNLIENIAPQYQKRSGGYTRIVKLGQRKSDGSAMAILELVK